MSKSPSPLRQIVLLRRLYDHPHAPSRVVLSRGEEAALMAACRLQSRMGGTVTALAVGEPDIESEALRAALCGGCDRAYCLVMNDVEELDYLGRATVLAAAARHVGFDLILCGDRSDDHRSGAAGPATAEILEVSHLSGVVDVAPDLEAVQTDTMTPIDHVIASHRQLGRIYELRWYLPTVLCMSGVHAALNTPLAASVRGAAAGDNDDNGHQVDDDNAHADGAPLMPGTLTLDDVGIEARALSHRKALRGPAHSLKSDPDTPGTITVVDAVARLRAIGILS